MSSENHVYMNGPDLRKVPVTRPFPVSVQKMSVPQVWAALWMFDDHSGFNNKRINRAAWPALKPNMAIWSPSSSIATCSQLSLALSLNHLFKCWTESAGVAPGLTGLPCKPKQVWTEGAPEKVKIYPGSISHSAACSSIFSRVFKSWGYFSIKAARSSSSAASFQHILLLGCRCGHSFITGFCRGLSGLLLVGGGGGAFAPLWHNLAPLESSLLCNLYSVVG